MIRTFNILVLIFILMISIVKAGTDNIIPGVAVITFDSSPDWDISIDQDGLIKTGRNDFDHLLAEYKATSFSQEFGTTRMGNVWVLRFDPIDNTDEFLKAIQVLDGVELVENDYTAPLVGYTYLPDDPLILSQWHLDAINAERGWAVSRGSEETVIGIIDGGVDYTHPDLEAAIWINDAEDINDNGLFDMLDINRVDDDNNGYVDDVVGYDWVDIPRNQVYDGDDPGPPDYDPMDYSGHGTHCAGDAAAATGNGLGVGSPGFGCRIAALRAGWMQIEGTGVVGLTFATSAINYSIDMEFSVISMSFGGITTDPTYFRRAMDDATNEGIILVGAAGNDSHSTMHYPAANPVVIAVAASDESGSLADFSNYGNWITITSPGDAIKSTGVGGSYVLMGGTSMATPVLAGVVAQLKALNPDWGYLDVVNRLTETAQPMQDNGTGAGLVDMGAALDIYVSVDSLWSLNAAGESRIGFNENGTLGLRWHKLDGSCNDVELSIDTDDPRVELGETTLQVGDVLAGDNGEWEIPVEITENDLLIDKIEIFANFSGTDDSGDEFNYTQILSFKAGHGQVLVINADRDPGVGGRVDWWYKTSFDSINIESETMLQEDIYDLSSTLDQYDMVIVAAGETVEDIFTLDELEAYAEYVSEGGNLLLSGQNIAEDLDVSYPMMLDTLFHVEFVEEHASRLTVRGIEGNSLSEEIYFILAGNGGARNQSSLDVISALDGAEPLFVYDRDEPERLAGVRIDYGDGEIVYCAFGIEAVNDSMNASSTRMEWLERLIGEWNNVDVGEETSENDMPAQFTVQSPFPNPTNGSVLIPFELSNNRTVAITMYDLLGRKVAFESITGISGTNKYQWNIPPSLSSGSYYIRFETSNISKMERVILLR
ncbi:MAG: S8/S53 family peptidase [Candidatus Electryonea clarkiae]|nr:S8/S53 family peptidase [Candidatus Electryonea clarkiae]MDP8285507.1 S8/S53 family peptidase [Candidatus Electryonea clarkiae]